MKHRKNIIIIGSIFLLVSICGLEFLREGSHVFQNSLTDANLKSLSIWIELYREDQGRYPDSLSGLLLNKNEDARGRQAIETLVDQVQHNVWRDSYDYKHSTNGFALTVIGPDGFLMGLFGKQRKIEKYYAVGEALKQ